MGNLASYPTAAKYRARLKRKRARFERRIRKDLRSELRYSERLVSEGWRAVAGLKPEGDRQGIVAALAYSGMANFDALVQLASQGHGKQALMLWRPMFERMLVAHWTVANPDLAIKRFEKQQRHCQLIANRVAGEIPNLYSGQVPFPPAKGSEEGTLNRMFGKWGELGVAGRKMHQLVEDAAGGFGESDADDLRKCHRTMYLESNQLLHTTSAIFESREGRFLLEMFGQPEESGDCRLALFSGFWTLMHILDTVQDQFHPDCLSSIKQLDCEGRLLFNTALEYQTNQLKRAVRIRLQIDDLIDQAKAAHEMLANTGADDPCRCGSGKAYKKCCRKYHLLIERWANIPKYGDPMLLRPDPPR